MKRSTEQKRQFIKSKTNSLKMFESFKANCEKIVPKHLCHSEFRLVVFVKTIRAFNWIFELLGWGTASAGPRAQICLREVLRWHVASANWLRTLRQNFALFENLDRGADLGRSRLVCLKRN